jgi:glutathione S-transferase
MSLTLVIGSKRFSSWSLRPWIALRHANIPFDEVLIPLRRADTKSRILAYSAAGQVPILIDGGTTVWESLAILDYVDRRHPDAGLWPTSLPELAFAKAMAAEMHGGFAAVRRELPMEIGARLPTPALSEEAQLQIARIVSLWRDARSRYGGDGPFLFGRFGNADAMFAPVVTRFETYGIAVDPAVRAYMDAIQDLPAMREWCLAAGAESSAGDEPST